MTRRLRASERKQAILDEASLLFAFKGLHGTTTKEIAKNAGISEPVLYQHFESKEEIYTSLELICSRQTAYFKTVIQELGIGVESLITITYLLIRVISFSKEPGVRSKRKESKGSEILLRLMGYSFLEEGHFARALVENCIGAFFDQWLESYKKAGRDGYLSVGKVEATSLWLSYESIIGTGLFVLPPIQLVDRIASVEEGAKAALLFNLRGLGLKESVIQKRVNWGALKKFFDEAMRLSAGN